MGSSERAGHPSAVVNHPLAGESHDLLLELVRDTPPIVSGVGLRAWTAYSGQ